MRLVTTKSESIKAEYDSWQEYLDFTQNAPLTIKGTGQSISGTYSFTHTRDKQECIKLATEGWPEGLELVQKTSLQEFNSVSSLIERPHYIFDYEGQQIDIARYVDQEPEVWLRQETSISTGLGRRIFRLFYNMSVSGGVNTSTIMQRGSAICALIQALEYSGNGVELTLVRSISGLGRGYGADKDKLSESYILLKAADQYLDMSRVAFALCHPSTLRRLGFAEMERLPFPDSYGVPNNNYGYPAESTNQGDIYFGSAHLNSLNWNNPEVVKEWIKKTLQDQGITLREENG